MSEINGMHEINGIPVGESIYRKLLDDTLVDEAVNAGHPIIYPYRVRKYGVSGRSRSFRILDDYDTEDTGGIRTCFFCGSKELYVKDYCEGCYNVFILGKENK